MFRGLIRDTPAFPAAEQEPALLAAGVPSTRAIYYDDLPGALISLRRDNRLIVCGFRALGKSRDEIDAEIEKVHSKNAAVMDATTKRLSTGKYRKALVDEAVRDLANERRGPRKDANKGKMPLDQVAVFWFNKLLKDKQVMAKVNGDPRYRKRWSHTAIWRKLKKRNGITGRPSNAKKS